MGASGGERALPRLKPRLGGLSLKRRLGDELEEEFEPTAYAAWFASPLGRLVWADERRALTQVLGEAGGRLILDAGAGDGRWAAELASEGARVVAIDASRSMAAAAKERIRGERRVYLVVGDAARLPFPPGCFDAATAVTLLCFVEHPRVVMAELGRVTRPGGTVVLGELGRWSLWAAIRRIRVLVRAGPWAGARFWTVRDLRALLRDAGLEPVLRAAAVFYPPSVLAAKILRPIERLLGRMSGVGAAFVAVAGRKRPAGREAREPGLLGAGVPHA